MSREEQPSRKKTKDKERLDIAEEERNGGERETWANKIQIFLSVLGYIIGLGNIWRFPYMVYENGGGAFLIPYLLCATVVGFPLFFLETALGQFMRLGAFDAWNIVPMMKGVGLSTIILAVYGNINYVVILAWSILYFFVTITNKTLPWTTCDNWWNTRNCMIYDAESKTSSAPNRSHTNNTTAATFSNDTNLTDEPALSIMEFWNGYVLRKSNGLEDMGSLENWPLLLSFTGAWILCYFCTFKGVKSTGKVTYFTATFPYVLLLILLVRGCTLPGASKGVEFYLMPNFTKLARPQVWVDAAGQIIYSYGICFTPLITFGSFNDFHYDCLRHTAKLVTCCSLTSFINGFAIFTVIGHLAHVQNVTVEGLPLSGPGLAFIAFPTALSLMPLPNLWNALFFFMLILLGIDTQFTTMEGVTTAIVDKWPGMSLKKYRRELLVGAVCIFYYLMGLPFVMNGGVYIFELFNFYAVSGIAVLSFALVEAVTVGHIYGFDVFAEDVKLMIGYKPPLYFKICLKYLVPVLMGSIVVFYFVMYSPLEVDGHVYSAGAQALGWILCMSSIVCIPGYGIYRIWNTRADGFRKKILEACAPVYPESIKRIKNEKLLARRTCDFNSPRTTDFTNA